MYRHNPQGLEFGTRYRIDSASGSATPVTVYRTDATTNPIGTAFTGQSGSNVREHDPRGGDTVFYAPQATLYLKPLDYLGVQLGGGAVITSTGVAPPTLPTGSGGIQGTGGAAVSSTAQMAVDAAFTGGFSPLKPGVGPVSVVDRNTQALRYFRQRLALRESARVDICVCPGDSLSEGQGATVLSKRWTDRLQVALRAKYPVSGVTGGYGYIAAQNVQTSFTYGLVTGAGTPTPPTAAYGYGRRTLQVQNATQTITLNSIAATAVDVYYTDGGGGTFAWAVDGGATTNVATTGSVGPKKVRVLTGGGGTSHTVVISWVSGNCIINGFDVFNGDEAAGVRVHNGGFNGAKAAAFVPNHSGQNYWPDHMASTLLNPALVLIPIGANEFKTGDSVSTYQANLAQMVTDIRTYAPLASICFVVEWELGGVTIVNPWSQYVAANYAVAAADGNIAVCDLYQLIGPHGAAETAGIILASDHQHPSDGGQLWWSDRLVEFLTAP